MKKSENLSVKFRWKILVKLYQIQTLKACWNSQKKNQRMIKETKYKSKNRKKKRKRKKNNKVNNKINLKKNKNKNRVLL